MKGRLRSLERAQSRYLPSNQPKKITKLTWRNHNVTDVKCSFTDSTRKSTKAKDAQLSTSHKRALKQEKRSCPQIPPCRTVSSVLTRSLPISYRCTKVSLSRLPLGILRVTLLVLSSDPVVVTTAVASFSVTDDAPPVGVVLECGVDAEDRPTDAVDGTLEASIRESTDAARDSSGYESPKARSSKSSS